MHLQKIFKIVCMLALCHAAALQAGEAPRVAPLPAAAPASAALAARALAKQWPALRIVSPKQGARIGPTIALEFVTNADLPKLTLSAREIATHLHVAIDATSLMPEVKDLKRIARSRYRYVFELPAEPGPHMLSVYWSDAAHKTIESTVRRVRVTVVSGQGKG